MGGSFVKSFFVVGLHGVEADIFLRVGRDEETCIALRCVRYDFDKATWARDWKGVFERASLCCVYGMEIGEFCGVDRMGLLA